jgi:hypothetical protein
MALRPGMNAVGSVYRCAVMFDEHRHIHVEIHGACMYRLSMPANRISCRKVCCNDFERVCPVRGPRT